MSDMCCLNSSLALLVSFSMVVEAEAIIFSASTSAFEVASLTICEALALALSRIAAASDFAWSNSFS